MRRPFWVWLHSRRDRSDLDERLLRVLLSDFSAAPARGRRFGKIMVESVETKADQMERRRLSR